MADKSKIRLFSFLTRIARFLFPPAAAPLEIAGDRLDDAAEREEQEFRRSEAVGTDSGRSAYEAGKDVHRG